MYKGTARSGDYTVVKREKYVGKYTINKQGKEVLVYRSSWEKSAFLFFENNPNVKAWSYESIIIPYLKPMPNGTMKLSKYYPDVYVEYINRNGDYKKELLEIKPKKQTAQSRSRNLRVKMYENYVLAVNMAKWEAARRWCATSGIEFKLITETSLFR